MENNTVGKKVFISYCWTTPEHEKWVLDLAERLENATVDVILDKWDLKPGHDTYSFMEKMVTDTTVDKVLIICDKGYKEKADNRAGGVGVETRIITPEVYASVTQEKFIPIIVECEPENFYAYVPVYVKGILGIDMTSHDKFGTSFEELMRCICDKPRYTRPAKGNIPSFLLDDKTKITIALKMKNEEISKLIDRDRKNEILFVANEFKDEFMSELEKYKIKENSKENCIKYFDEMKIIRDEYLINIVNLIKVLSDEELVDYIVEFFEEIYTFREFDRSGVCNDFEIGHYSLLIHEMFLWTNTLLFNYKRYQVIADILESKYFVDTSYGENKKESGCFYDEKCIINRYRTEDMDRVSLDADKLIERCYFNNHNYKEDLVITDLMIYYAKKINKKAGERWFPKLYIYLPEYKKIKALEKLYSKKYFDKVKCIFGIDTDKEFRIRVKEVFTDMNMKGYSNSWSRIPNLINEINLELIASEK